MDVRGVHDQDPQHLPAAQPPAGATAAAPSAPGGYREWAASNAYPEPGPTGTNGRAVACLILAVVGGGVGFALGAIPVLVVAVVSAALGVDALGQIRRREQRGRGLAIAGLVVSGLWVLMVVVFIFVRPDAPRLTDPGVNRAVQGKSLAPGDCLRTIDGSAAAAGPPVLPCGDPHAAEVYTVFTFPDGPYPGDAELEGEVEKRSARSFKPYLSGNESMDLYWLRPSSMSWPLSRQVTCIAVDPQGTRTGSLVG
ncbi:DUF4190 domain-containing protein [Actinoplanes sp. NPDC049118]|uniref:DUF4190 domain-containing protein n=1 Tax=Actinoplanes sp. NPDC049118 TaxID=3155769 RepID=UPI003406E752